MVVNVPLFLNCVSVSVSLLLDNSDIVSVNKIELVVKV